MRLKVAWTVLTIPACLSACQSAPAKAEPEAAVMEAPSRQIIDTRTYCADIDALKQTTSKRIHLATLEAVRDACSLDTGDVTLLEATTRLDGSQIALQADGDTLTLFQVSDGTPPFSCCSLQDLNWRNLGDDRTWVTRLHLKDLQAGMLTQFPIAPGPGVTDKDILKWRGPDAPPAPPLKPDPDGTITEQELYSPQLGETRRLFVYQPAGTPSGATLPVLVLTDGEELPFWARVIEPMIDSRRIAPVLIIGLVSGQGGIIEDRSDLGSDIRNIDYLPSQIDGHPPSRFDDHLAFVTETVLPWAETNFGASKDRHDRAVAGMSSGGGFALNAGFRRPDVFAHAWPMSPGMDGINTVPPAPTSPVADFRISAGYYEPIFIRGARISAANLTAAGYQVDTRWFPAGHMKDQWELRLLDNLEAVFPGPASARLLHDQG
jgi:enterochelin esterase-like enzyme